MGEAMMKAYAQVGGHGRCRTSGSLLGQTPHAGFHATRGQGYGPVRKSSASSELTMKTPTKITISATELAELTRYSVRYLRDLAHTGLFPPATRGVYEALPAFRGIIKHLRTAADEARTGLAAKRKAHLSARTKLLEIEIGVAQGEYLKKSVIGPAFRNLSLNQRACLQRKLESELGPKLAGATPLEIQAHMRDAVDEICNVFRNGSRQWMESPP